MENCCYARELPRILLLFENCHGSDYAKWINFSWPRTFPVQSKGRHCCCQLPRLQLPKLAHIGKAASMPWRSINIRIPFQIGSFLLAKLNCASWNRNDGRTSQSLLPRISIEKMLFSTLCSHPTPCLISAHGIILYSMVSDW